MIHSSFYLFNSFIKSGTPFQLKHNHEMELSPIPMTTADIEPISGTAALYSLI